MGCCGTLKRETRRYVHKIVDYSKVLVARILPNALQTCSKARGSYFFIFCFHFRARAPTPRLRRSPKRVPGVLFCVLCDSVRMYIGSLSLSLSLSLCLVSLSLYVCMYIYINLIYVYTHIYGETLGTLYTFGICSNKTKQHAHTPRAHAHENTQARARAKTHTHTHTHTHTNSP